MKATADSKAELKDGITPLHGTAHNENLCVVKFKWEAERGQYSSLESRECTIKHVNMGMRQSEEVRIKYNKPMFYVSNQ